ncbi:MAG: peptide-methionine (S)-S-oxide reductase MsrA [Acidobacteriia bacterium]|nr:peptide-methionine (S)-S-oxide reductase MsrA [Terriglobia bacterium]
MLGGMLMMSWISTAFSADGGKFPDPATDVKPGGAALQTAVLAGGCFWCTEAVFEQLAGVKEVVSGYAGGSAQTAHYDVVSAGQTDHAEVIQVSFDAAKISYGRILKIFFSVAHDPTQVNRQGPDWGRQYRSSVFYADAEQKRVAEAYIAQLNQAKVFSAKIATEVVPLTKFYAAEGYHQDFVKRNPAHPYVVVNAKPKVAKVRKAHPDQVK